jgi:hypothetical protein
MKLPKIFFTRSSMAFQDEHFHHQQRHILTMLSLAVVNVANVTISRIISFT